MTVKEKLGQLLMFGFPGTEPAEEALVLMEEYKAGNIILFSHNIVNAAQTKELCDKLKNMIAASTGVLPIISIDQEGGVVSRMPKDAVSFPSAMAVAATKDAGNAYQAAYDTGKELAAMGVNCNLAPVADLNTNKDNPVIGVRSYGISYEEAVPFILSVIRGQEAAGIASVAKHFPGHGDTMVDSHLGLPCIRKQKEELAVCELIPFQKAIAQDVPIIMAAHILYPALDDTGVPASMSEKILRGLLREEMGFQGAVITDCLEMGAIQDHYGTPEGFVKAIIAGVDMACISHTPQTAIKALTLAERAVESGELTMERLDEAVGKVLALKQKYADASADIALINQPKHREAAETIMQEAVVRLDAHKMPEIGSSAFFVGCPVYRSTFASEVRADDKTFPQVMAEHFKGSYMITQVNPDEAEAARALDATEEGQTVVAGTYNGHLNTGQIALVNALCQAGRRVIAVALRNPYDLELIHDDACKIAAFEYTELSLGAVKKVLEGCPAVGSRCW